MIRCEKQKKVVTSERRSKSQRLFYSCYPTPLSIKDLKQRTRTRKRQGSIGERWRSSRSIIHYKIRHSTYLTRASLCRVSTVLCPPRASSIKILNIKRAGLHIYIYLWAAYAACPFQILPTATFYSKVRNSTAMILIIVGDINYSLEIFDFTEENN